MPLDVEARVIQNTRLSPDYNVITLAAPEIAAATKPGQFVMVRPGHGSDPLLRRPFSVFEIIRSGNRIEGTLTPQQAHRRDDARLLFDAVYGDVISCLGPLGRPFETVSPPAKPGWSPAVSGSAPFATLTEALRERGTTTTLFYGARTGAELFYLDWFSSRGVRVVLSTEDGSSVNEDASPVPSSRRSAASGEITIYACGPERMLEAVSHVAANLQETGASIRRARDGMRHGRLLQLRHPGTRAGGGHHYVRSCLAGPCSRPDLGLG